MLTQTEMDFFKMLNIDIKKKHFYHYWTLPNSNGKKMFVQSNKTISDIYNRYLSKTSQMYRAENCYFYINEGKNKFVTSARTIKNKNGEEYQQEFRKEVESRKQEERKRYNAFYFDFDLHDGAGRHYQGTTLTQLKGVLYNMLLERLPLEASAIVESGNGFHVYFAINDKSLTENEWKSVETQMISYMYCNVSTDIDFAVSDASRVLRIPGTFHYKRDSRGRSKVAIVYFTGRQYDVASLKTVFCGAWQQECVKQAKKGVSQRVNVKVSNNAVIDAIRRLDDTFFVGYVTKLDIDLSVEAEADYIKGFDMIYFLQLDIQQREVFNSILREDKTASVAIDNVCSSKGKNVYLYHDFALNRTYDLIHVVCELAHCDNKTAFQFLCKVFFVPVHHATQDIDAFIKSNMDIIDELAQVKAYKFLIKLIPTYRQILCNLKTRSNLTGVSYRKYKLQCASQFLAEQTGNKRTNVVTHLRLLEFIGIICKVGAYSHKEGRSSINTFVITDLMQRKEKIMHQIDVLKSHYSNVFRASQKDLDKIIGW